MPGRGRTPKPQAVRRNTTAPVRGEWEAAETIGWQFGDVPDPPDGLLEASRTTWTTWMGAWFAAHWIPEDLPGLEVVILLHDQVRRGEFQRANELRLQMDTYGITPKGQQDRRWQKPTEEKAPAAPVRSINRRKQLKVV